MKSRNLAILFFNMFVVMLSFGIIIPILPFLVESFGGSGLAMGGLMTIFSLMQFIFSPIWGGLSDRFGRKPVLMIGAIGNGLGMLLMGLAPNMPLLYVGRAVGGILSSATQAAAMAYISDSTDEKSRGGGMGLIGAAFGLGMVFGPGIGGMTAAFSHGTPFFIGAGLSALGMVLIWFFLPESLQHEKRQHGLKIRGIQLNLMLTALAGPIGFLLIQAFLNNFALTNFEGMFAMYAQRRFNFDEMTIGTVMIVVGLVSSIAQGVLTGPATRRFGDANVVKMSLIGSAIGFVLMLTATDLTTVMITTAFFVFTNSMLRPGISSLISKRTDSGQGIAMGLNNAYMSLGRIIGPLWAGTVLDINLNYPFLSGGLIMLGAFIASLFFLHTQASAPEPVSPSNN
jgi:DHA1 family multidrug resistance protein-like MFS transporter